MSTAAATTLPHYPITSDLNRQSLPSAERDPQRKVAWMNAICVLVLAVGVLMTKEPAELAFKPEVYEPPLAIELPQIAPPTTPDVEILRPDEIPEVQDTPQPAVIVVAPETAKVPFAVPVVGATLVSTDLRQVSAPPKLLVVPKAPALTVLKFSERGNYGNIPWPTDKDYPPEAKARREQGDVIMVIDVGAEGGAPKSVVVEKSSGSEYLDIHAREWVKTKFDFNPGQARRMKFMFSYTLGL